MILSRGTCILLLLFLAACLLTPALVKADKYDTCLDYWSVGTSGCEKAKKEKKETLKNDILPPEILEESVDKPEHLGMSEDLPKTLDDKIDDFLKDHGKPPREFAAFTVEPTLENALKWVETYNTEIERGKSLTKAWLQAAEIYKQQSDAGNDLTGLVSEDALPEVPDFGIDVGMDLGALKNYGVPGMDPLLNPTPLPKKLDKSGINGNLVGGNTLQVRQPVMSNSIAGNSDFIDNNGIIKIDYYFSAECPYCAKFEPEFREIMTELGGKLDVTCVDMTPSKRTAENINGKLNCAWRSIQPGEIQRVGIKATPSLVINRGGKTPLERITGYIEKSVLRGHLVK